MPWVSATLVNKCRDAQRRNRTVPTDAALLGTAEEHRSRVADMVLDTAVADADAVRVATGVPV